MISPEETGLFYYVVLIDKKSTAVITNNFCGCNN